MSGLKVKLRPAWRNYWLGWLMMVSLLFIAFSSAVGAGSRGEEVGVGFWLASASIIFIIMAFKRWSWKFVIDEHRVIRHYGIISRNQQSVRIKDLRSVALQQSLLQRLLGIGDLAFYSAGSADAEVRFFGISQPVKWRDRIDQAMDQLKG